jgi:hypothetical protein
VWKIAESDSDARKNQKNILFALQRGISARCFVEDCGIGQVAKKYSA